jgi:hypothetical protein
LIEVTMTALQRRYAEWGSDPATPAELTSILNALSALQRLMNETLARYGEAPDTDRGEISDAAQRCDKLHEALTKTALWLDE